jgi:hypothetical protein
MESIFGKGAHDELFFLINGIYIHPAIKKAFGKGFLARSGHESLVTFGLIEFWGAGSRP